MKFLHAYLTAYWVAKCVSEWIHSDKVYNYVNERYVRGREDTGMGPPRPPADIWH